ncbi:response regulator transcription factor [Eggerthella sinensis]|uniref:response regulator transcription factor n=1 Tax=Eggerthella sinensis TaxID=242230 RepID=UPI00266B5547|nr:helix-turn-helix transcriptional regulator [Eggerthella sinensis]
MDALSTVKKRWFLLAAAGLAACLVLFGEGASISSRASVETFAVMTGENPLSGGVTIMAAFLLVAVFARPAARMLSTTAFLAVDAVANALGAALLLSDLVGLGGNAPLSEAGGLLIGFGSALLLVRWADFLVPLGAKTSSLCLATALAFVMAFDVLSKALIDLAFVLAVLALCALSPLLLVRASRGERAEREECALQPHDSIEEYRGVVPVWLSFASIVFYAVVMGGVQLGGMAVNTVFDGVAEVVASTGIAVDAGMLVAVVVIVAGVRFLHGNNMSFYRLTILALLAVSLYLSAVLSANWSAVNLVIMTVARMLIFAYVWSMFSTPAKTMSPIRLFSVGWLLFLVPNNVAMRVGQAVLGTEGPLVVFELALAVILLLLFVFEFTPLLTDRSGSGSADGATDGGKEDAFAARIATLVEQGGLTPREQDVLVALARGRSAQYVADTFVVSKETARTHIRHVYQKLEVHSREELMDLVESELG